MNWARTSAAATNCSPCATPTDGVEVDVRGPDGEQRLTARYLVGCDGGRSTVRKAVGFDFPGTAATLEMYLADVKGVELEPRLIGETVDGGMVMVGPLGDGGITRIIVCERGTPPGGAPSPRRTRRSRRPGSGSPVSTSRTPSRCGSAPSATPPVWSPSTGAAGSCWRATPRTSICPAGGQGMNTGIQDAVNLGWKLAAVVRGHRARGTARHLPRRAAPGRTAAADEHPGAGPALPERRRGAAAARRAPRADPVRGGQPPSRRHGERPGDPLRRRARPPSRCSACACRTWNWSATGARPAAPNCCARPGACSSTSRTTPSCATGPAGWSDRVDIVTAAPHGLSDDSPLAGTSAVLVRPDGHVAWAAPGSHHDLPMALERWFGPSRGPKS